MDAVHKAQAAHIKELEAQLVEVEAELKAAIQSKRRWKRCYNEMKQRLNDLMVEAAFVYNELRDGDKPEMSSEEMYDYLMSRGEAGMSAPAGYYGTPLTPQVGARL